MGVSVCRGDRVTYASICLGEWEARAFSDRPGTGRSSRRRGLLDKGGFSQDTPQEISRLYMKQPKKRGKFHNGGDRSKKRDLDRPLKSGRGGQPVSGRTIRHIFEIDMRFGLTSQTHKKRKKKEASKVERKF